MAVIKDVAKRAGVSIGTVSKFFNHPETLRSSTYQRVADAVEALDYRPSAIARSMRTGHTNIVAILVPEISNPFYAEAYSLLAGELTAVSFLPLLITTDGNPVFQDKQKLSLLFSHTDAAVLYLLDNHLNARLLDFFAELSKPCIVVSQRPEDAPYNIVIQETEGAYSAAEYLFNIGRRRIAFIGGPADDEMTKDKYAGFFAALEERGIAPCGVQYCPHFTPGAAYHAAAAIHRQLPGEAFPDAVFCANDSLSMGSLKYLSEQGYSVPSRVAIIGFDDLPICRLTQPELSSVALPLADIATEAKALLLHAAQARRKSAAGAANSFNAITLSTTLRIRASSLEDDNVASQCNHNL